MDPETLDYARPHPNKPVTIPLCGVVSLLLCGLQFPWLACLGMAMWMFVWGDNPEPQGFTVWHLIALLPAFTAIVLGAVAVWRSRFVFDRIAGVLGLLGAAGWIVFWTGRNWRLMG